MQDSNLLVDRNLDALSRIVTSKYERGERSVYNTFGQSYPRVDVTLEDMKSSGEEFTAEVLKVKAMSEAMTRRGTLAEVSYFRTAVESLGRNHDDSEKRQ